MSNFTSPAIQAMNIIRYIGDEISQSGKPIQLLSCDDLDTVIGAPSEDFVEQLIEDLSRRNIVKFTSITHAQGTSTLFSFVSLTLDGWEQYEAEKRGVFKGNYGFIARQLDDPQLDAFVKDTVKPAVKEGLGYDLVDMRDIAQAEVIDNVTRTQIRDAAFVLADLTHNSLEAYWGAGYAESLGKPVIYICEQEKFKKEGTHFDTNHCTTVLWSRDDDESFKQVLIATLRRSLGL